MFTGGCSLQELHYLLWLIARELRTFINREIILGENTTVCRADIMRYEIVYKYGGVYSDIDSLSVKPLGQIFRHSFVSITSDKPPYYIQNCIFGFPRGSNFLFNVLASVKIHQKQIVVLGVSGIPYKYGPIFFTSVFVSGLIRGVHVAINIYQVNVHIYKI